MGSPPGSPRPARCGRPAADGIRALAVLAVLVTAALALTQTAAPRGSRPNAAAVPARQVAARRSGPRALPAPGGVLLPAGRLSTALAALQAAYLAVVREVQPEVVQITTGTDLGSGIVFDARGDIVTNDHVVGSARRVTVTLANGRVVAGRVVGTDPTGDLAVVRIHAGRLTPARFAPPGAAEAGAIVLAVGNPLGFQSSVSVGIVSAVGRRVTEPDGVTLSGAIQTSAEINPGNSGGALVDLAGQVVGIPTVVALSQQAVGEAPGIGFAVPSRTVARVARELIRRGRVVAAAPELFGLAGGDVVGPTGDPLGVLVTNVRPASPMARAGLLPQQVVVAVGARATWTVAQLGRALAPLRRGRALRLTVVTPAGRRLHLAVRRSAAAG